MSCFGPCAAVGGSIETCKAGARGIEETGPRAIEWVIGAAATVRRVPFDDRELCIRSSADRRRMLRGRKFRRATLSASSSRTSNVVVERQASGNPLD